MRGAHVYISIDIHAHTFIYLIRQSTRMHAQRIDCMCVFLYEHLSTTVFIWLKPEDCTVCIILHKTNTRALSFLYGSGAVLIHESVESSVRRQPLS